MNRSAAYLAACAGAVAFCLGFGFPAAIPTRVFWYWPLEHRWSFEVRASGITMDWYGRMLLACLFGAAGLGLGWFFGKRKPLSRSMMETWAAWVAIAVVLVSSFYAFQLYRRVPTPAPLPSWYVPQ